MLLTLGPCLQQPVGLYTRLYAGRIWDSGSSAYNSFLVAVLEKNAIEQTNPKATPAHPARFI